MPETEGLEQVYSFGDVWEDAKLLPRRDARWDFGSEESFAPFAELPGGLRYSAYGAAVAPARAGTLYYSAVEIYTNPVAVQVGINTQKAMRGQYSKLWKYDGTYMYWRWATLVKVDALIDTRVPLLVRYGYAFECEAPGWRHGLIEDEVALVASPQDVTVTNEGDEIHDCIFYITAGDADITALTVGDPNTGGWEWRYLDTISAGKVLTVDCGARAVLISDVAQYAYFELTPAHRADEWCRILAQTDTLITVTRTGGGAGSTFRYAFHDRYG